MSRVSPNNSFNPNRLGFALALLLCSCASEQSLPALDRLKGLTVAELEQRLGKPDASPSSEHRVYLAKRGDRSGSGVTDSCALHITLRDGVVVEVTGVESDQLCRELLKTKGF